MHTEPHGTQPPTGSPWFRDFFAGHPSAPVVARTGVDVLVASPSDGPGRPQHAVNAAHRGILWQALHTLDAAPPVELVREHGDTARRLTAIAERVEAALLVIGAATNPAKDDQGADAVSRTVLADSGLPGMFVPRASVDTAVAHNAAGAPLHA